MPLQYYTILIKEMMEMREYYHSVRLNKERCKGCVHCLQCCPTQAIRVKGGKAVVLGERCIDCGECFRVCPNSAKIVASDSLSTMKDYKYTVVLPPPSFFVQFPPDIEIPRILEGLKALGFNSIFEVGIGAELVVEEIKRILKEKKPHGPDKPFISSSCPAVVRLIQVNYPNLVEQIVPLDAPMDITAHLAKDYISRTTHTPIEQIGAFFLTSCSAKVTSIKSPEGRLKSPIDRVIPVSSIYVPLLEVMGGMQERDISQEGLLSSGLGIGWGITEGIPMGIGLNHSLSVNGIHNVIEVLDEVELGHLDGLEYIECQACYGGCIGGFLNVQNRFLAEVRIKNLIRSIGSKESVRTRLKEMIPGDFNINHLKIEPRPMKAIGETFIKSAEMLSKMEEITRRLPGLDCGSCGSPTCSALAEDIVCGRAKETDCIFKLIHMIESKTGEIQEITMSLPSPVKRSSYQESEGGD